MIQNARTIGRAQLQRRLTLVCGCVVDLPMLDSEPSVWARLTHWALNRPRYVQRCDGAPNHRTLNQVLGR